MSEELWARSGVLVYAVSGMQRTIVRHSRRKFSGGEIQVRLLGRVGPRCEIFANLFDSESIMELLMLTDAIRRAEESPFIHLIMPYFPYARQDRVCAPGEAFSAFVMAGLINAQYYDSLEIWDAHSFEALRPLNGGYTNVHCSEFVRNVVALENYDALVSPDKGALDKVRACGAAVNLPVIEAVKVRNPDNGEITGTEIPKFGAMVNQISPYVLIVDDICDGGRTFVELAKVLKASLIDPVIDLYVTHGIFSQGAEPFRGLIRNIYCANPFPGAPGKTICVSKRNVTNEA